MFLGKELFLDGGCHARLMAWCINAHARVHAIMEGGASTKLGHIHGHCNCSRESAPPVNNVEYCIPVYTIHGSPFM